jgi:hypothetical protein
MVFCLQEKINFHVSIPFFCTERSHTVFLYPSGKLVQVQRSFYVECRHRGTQPQEGIHREYSLFY